MDKFERVKLALEHKEPDRIPTLSCMDVQNYVYEALGEPVPSNITAYFGNPLVGKLVDWTAPFLNKIGGLEKDFMTFFFKKVEADIKMGFDAVWNVHAEIFRLKDSKHMVDIWGRHYKIVFDNDGNMLTPAYIGGLFETPEDWKAWNKKEWDEHPEKLYRFNREINDRFGQDIYIFGSHLYGLFEQTWQPFGFEKFIRLLQKDKTAIEDIIEYNKEWYLKCIDASAEAGFPSIIYSDDMAFKNGPMLNPKMMDRLFGAAFKELTDHAHKKGLKIIIHTDGNTKPLLKYFMDWGFDGHHSIEPNADNVDIGEFREIVDHRLSLLGHLDITHVLSFGTEEEVFDHVKDVTLKAGRGGGLILGPCNSHYEIKLQNLKWMLEACEQMTYPLT
ncbi:MAG: hypothetical protein GY866_05795 [Proteobacteria bacterium]|nr:hypothetical protein [Pseudomonadota bacterium]